MADEHGDRLVRLDDLYRGRRPSAELEDRITGDYARSVRPLARLANPRRWSVRIAAGVALFLAGYGAAFAAHAGDASEAAGAHAAAGDRWYMLLLWQDDRFDDGPTDAAVAEEYVAWARAAARSGMPIDGAELAPERTLVATTAQSRTSDGHPVIGGYFIVAVPDRPAARRVAEGHPHVHRGGWIEIAEVIDGGPR